MNGMRNARVTTVLYSQIDIEYNNVCSRSSAFARLHGKSGDADIQYSFQHKQRNQLK
jgi:hypothetical protein